jgi:malonate transporter
MRDVLPALAPVAALIALGLALRRSGFMPPSAWPPLERLVYHVLFPALLFGELARAPFAGQPLGAMAATLLGAQLAGAALAGALRRPLRLPGPAYTSLLQGVVRWNSYVVLSLVPPLFGREALPLCAVAIALLVPAANVLSVAALARHGAGRGGPAVAARAVLTNPLILACAAGLAWNAAGLPVPAPLGETLATLARAAVALGLLAVGAGLEGGAALARPLPLLAACAGKLLALPLVAYALGSLLGLSGAPLGVAVLALASPTATSAYVLARLLGGDADLMAAIVTATTVGALVTLPLVLSLPFG